MQEIQQEVRAENPKLNIEILGINFLGSASANPLITPGRTLPWLQDTVQAVVWNRWQVVYRDVRILDSQNRIAAVFNLTTQDLGLEMNRAALKQLFLETARTVDSDGDQLPDDWEMLSFNSLQFTGSDDPDADTCPNSIEFAFGTDPNDPASFHSVAPRLISSNDNQLFAVTFRQRAGSFFDYIVETSTDLIAWGSTRADVRLVEPARNLFDGAGTLEAVYSLAKPISAQPTAFVRIKAIAKP